MKIDVDKIELVALDPKKFNILVIHLPEGATQASVQEAHDACSSLREKYNLPVLVAMPGYRAELGTQE